MNDSSTDSGSDLKPEVDTVRRCCFASANRRKTLDAVIAEMEDEPVAETKLGLIDLLCIGVGSTVGSGVFVLTGQVLPIAGPSASLSWVFAGIACLLSGFAYMELSARLPTRGSCYTFSYHGLGELWAVIGAFCITLEYGISGAGVARNWSQKMGSFLGDEYKHTVFFYFGKGTWPADATAAQLADNYARTDDNYLDLSAAFLTAGCTLLLMGGLSLSKAVVNFMTFLKVLLVIFMVICGFTGASQNIFESGEVFAPGGINGVINATTLLFFGFIGFDEVCCLSSKAKNASRTMPLALIGTLAIAAMVSFTAQLAISLISQPGQASDFGVAFEQMGWTVISWIVRLGELILLPLVVLLSILPQPEVSAAMSTDRLIPSIFRRQASDGTFVWGLALTGLIALTALALACPFSILWDVISLGVLLSFNLSNASLINIRYGNGGAVCQPRVAKLVRVLFVSAIVAGYINWKEILHVTLTSSTQPELWALILGPAFSALTVFLTVYIACYCKQVQDKDQGDIFKAPLVPYIPALGIYVNATLMAGISWTNHLVFAALLAAWLLLYLLYPCMARARKEAKEVCGDDGDL
ncbi:unnamed protein product [Durusdinium trenchii]|uniref:Cationic amino acid transporter C-terminal domain-containing protein n=2 Tax=Durusdinium trenchii TaxID=1381693 RepID=A0ABP0R349_9DINO